MEYEYNDIDIDYFDFFTSFDKTKFLCDYLSESSSIVTSLDNISDLSGVIDTTLLNDSISNLKDIVDKNSGKIVKFFENMEKTKEVLRQFPDSEIYFENYDLIVSKLGADYFANGGVITPDVLPIIYPGFDELIPERKILIYDFFLLLGMGPDDVVKYNNIYIYYDKDKKDYVPWCAYSVGGIIENRFGIGTIFPESYASVWKIVGRTTPEKIGIAFADDPRKRFILSDGSLELLYGNDGSIYDKWVSETDKYNSNNGTDFKVTDWIDDSYVPTGADLIIFDDKSNGTLPYLSSGDAYSHIGMVVGVREVDGVKYVDTIEGNVSDRVQFRTYRIDDPSILGYCHIDYEEYGMVDSLDPTRKLTDEEIREIESKGINGNEIILGDIDLEQDKFIAGNTR